MTPDVQYRWLNGWEATDIEWDRVETIIETRGWIPLNRRTTRVLLAETAAGGLVGFIVLQLIPHVEPLFVAPSMRATGVAEDLAERHLADGDTVDLVSVWKGEERRLERLRCVSYPTPRGCAATYFPEANVLVPLDSTALESNTPTSKSLVVRLERSAAPR